MHIQVTTSMKIVVNERCKPNQNYYATHNQTDSEPGMNPVSSNCYIRDLTS